MTMDLWQATNGNQKNRLTSLWCNLIEVAGPCDVMLINETSGYNRWASVTESRKEEKDVLGS